MWFGTDKGLACFDGIRFQSYGVAEGLPDPEVLNLVLDSKGRLWISCFEKKPCYRYKGEFYTENNDSLLRKINLNSAILDYYEEKGRGVWITGFSRSFYFLADTATTYHPDQLVVQKSALLGFGQIDHQLLAIKRDSLILYRDGKEAERLELPNSIVSRSFKDFLFLGNRIFFSTNGNTEVLEYQNRQVHSIRQIENLGGRLFVDREGVPWISSTQFGCSRLNSFIDQHLPDEKYLPDKKVNQFFQDNDGGKWFCTYGDGIYYLPLNAAVNYNSSNGTQSDNVTALYFDGTTIWFGDDESNLYTIRNGVCQRQYNLSTPGLNRIRGIAQINDYYLVASDRGTYILDKGKSTLCTNSDASKFVVAQGQQFYYGTSNRLFQRSIQEVSLGPIFENRCTAGALDANGVFWVGSLNAFYSSADNFTRNWAERFPELKSRIVSIAGAGENGLWIATSTIGLLRAELHNGEILRIEKINDKLGTPVSNIQSIYTDQGEWVWLATNNGVYGINRQYHILNFNKNNGLAANDVNAVFVQKDTLWAATVSGLSKLILRNEVSDHEFSTLISYLRYKHSMGDVYLNLLDSSSSQKTILLDSQSSLVELGFGGLDYSSHLNMRFQCVVKKCLPPLYWVTVDNLFTLFAEKFRCKTDTFRPEVASLNFGVNLASGKYQVRVYAINASGVPSRQPDSLVFIKKPYWYQTIWFWLAIWGLMFWGIRRMVSMFGENKKLQTRISELQLQAIKLQINPHFIGNSVNALQKFFFPPDFLRANAYIEIFTRLLRTTMNNAEKVFYPIEQEISYLDDYLNMTGLRFGEHFQYTIEVAPEVSLNFPFPVMVLQPLVENATIHGLASDGNSFLHISFEYQNGRVICKIQDNGPGLNQTKKRKTPKKSHISKGLSLTFDKVHTINELYKIDASLNITDLADQGNGEHGTLAIFSYSPGAPQIPSLTRAEIAQPVE